MVWMCWEIADFRESQLQNRCMEVMEAIEGPKNMESSRKRLWLDLNRYEWC